MVGEYIRSILPGFRPSTSYVSFCLLPVCLQPFKFTPLPPPPHTHTPTTTHSGRARVLRECGTYGDHRAGGGEGTRGLHEHKRGQWITLQPIEPLAHQPTRPPTDRPTHRPRSCIRVSPARLSRAERTASATASSRRAPGSRASGTQRRSTAWRRRARARGGRRTRRADRAQRVDAYGCMMHGRDSRSRCTYGYSVATEDSVRLSTETD